METEVTVKLGEDSFEKWMDEVDNLCLSEYGISIHDLPDMEFRDCFDCGQSPRTFFEENIGDMDDLEDLILS